MSGVDLVNKGSELALRVGTGAGAFAMAVVSLNIPISAMGGAIFGVVHHVAELSLNQVEGEIFKQHPRLNAEARKIVAATAFLGSYAAAWWALAAVGFTLSLGQAVLLSIVGSCTKVFIQACIDALAGPSSRVLRES